MQLQDSCREAKNEAADLRNENAQLKLELKSKILRQSHPHSLWQQGKKADSDPQGDDYSPMFSYASVHPLSGPVLPHMNSGHVHYTDDGLRYPDPATPLPGPSYHGAAQDYPQRSPAMGFACVESEAPGGQRPHTMEPQRMTRYDQYNYPLDGNSRDSAWQQAVGPPTSESGALDSGSSSHSPSFIESPSLTTTDLSYSNRYVDDQKLSLDPLTTSPTYMFSTSRSLSPAVSTPTSSSSSLASTAYAFTFPEGSAVQDRPEFNYRRSHGTELTLHGGTADITIAPPGDGVRYRLGGRSKPMPDRPMPHAISPYSRTENGSNERESDESESASYTYSARARLRSANATSRSSRSPSPGPPPICGTLAVIKAQAFGALRRTRTRSKKSSEGAAKAAVEALEARGIGMGISTGSKRPRLHHDEGDMDM